MRASSWTRRMRTCLWIVMCIACASAAPARDRGTDGQFSERRSRHFLLLQDVDIDDYTGVDGSRKFERDVLAVLEHAYDQVRDVLGIAPDASVRVVVYDAGVYDREFSGLFGFRSAGFWDGAIHVRAGVRVDARLVGTLHHEYVHAALEALGGRGRFPAWLNEGLAEYFERPFGFRGLASGEVGQLRRQVAAGAWIPLEALSGTGFARLGGHSAALAYLQAFAIVDLLVRLGGEQSLERLCERVARSGDVRRSIKRTYRRDLEDLEAELIASLG